MTEGVRLPLSHRITRHQYTCTQWIALDVVAALFFGAGFMGKVAMLAPSGPSGTGWQVARYAMVGVLFALVPLRRLRPTLTVTVLPPLVACALCIGVPPHIVGPVALILYTAASTLPRRQSLRHLYLLVAAVAVGAGIGSRTAGIELVPALIATIAVLTAAWLAGENAQSHRAYAKAVAERAADRDREREERMRQASNDERVRIARELHDIVAHSMSVIAVRAGVARVVMDSQPNEAREALTLIETITRTALQEMRLLVGVLRRSETPDGGLTADLQPAPGVGDLDRLIADVGAAGVEVELVIEGDVRQLAPGVDLSAYRIVQEALTNTVRHVGPSRARVILKYAARELLITVTDEGRSGTEWDARRTSPAFPVDARANPTGHRLAPSSSAPSSGHGLIGMRERAALFGGELCAGPAPTGGFSVVARVRTDEVGR